jgi:WD40 repeat protein
LPTTPPPFVAHQPAFPVAPPPASPVAAPIVTPQSPAPPGLPLNTTNAHPRLAELLNAKLDQLPVRILEGHLAPVTHIVFTPDSTHLISTSNSHHVAIVGGRKTETAGDDNTVRVWEVASGKQIRKFLVNDGHGYPAQGLCVSPDGRLAAVCTSAAFVRPDGKAKVLVWEIATGRQTVNFLLPGNHAVRAIGFSADGRKLYVVRSGTRVHSISIPEGVDSGAVILEGQSLREAPFGTMLTSGCRFVLGGSWSGPVQLWDRQTGKLVRSFEGPTKVANAVAMSPRGTRIAAGAQDFSLRVWETATGQQIFGKQTLDAMVTSIAFSRDSKRLLTGGADGAVHIFDIGTQKEFRRLTGHTGIITCVVYSPDGRLAASTGADMSIRLWQLPHGPL